MSRARPGRPSLHVVEPARLGVVRAHGRDGSAWRRPSRLVAPRLRHRGRGRGARSVPDHWRRAGHDPRALHLAHRPAAETAALEPRRLVLARVLQGRGRGARHGAKAALVRSCCGRRGRLGSRAILRTAGSLPLPSPRRGRLRSSRSHRGPALRAPGNGRGEGPRVASIS